MKTAERVFENFADDVIQSWERGGKADLPILISQALLALREVVVPTEEEIYEKAILPWWHKNAYTQRLKPLAKAIRSELLHRLNQ